MAQDQKPQPAATPPGPSLADRISNALEDVNVRRRVSVKLTVKGGLPSKKYSFEFSASGDGSASCRFEDQLKSRKADSSTQKTAYGDKEFVALLRKVQPALARPVERPSFLPDTLVGILEVSDGSSVRRIYFAADSEQAKTQNQIPPPEVQQAVDAVYAAGATLSGARSMKP
jgi:hypothetical protein